MSTTGTQLEIYQESPAWQRRPESAAPPVAAEADRPTMPPSRLTQSPPAPWVRLQLAGLLLAPLLLISYVYWDRPLLLWARALSDTKPPWAVLLGWASHGTIIILALLTLVAVALRTGQPRVWRWALVALLSFIASGLSCSLLKFVFGRYRPSRLFEGMYGFELFSVGYDFNGFPSGHAVAIGALMGVAILVRPRLAAGWMLLAAGWSSARLFTLSHYASDVMVGLFYGCAWSFFIYSLTIRRRWWTRQFELAR